MKVYTPAEVKEWKCFTPFTYSLIEMDSRFRLFSLYDEVFQDKGYVPLKEKGVIYMPCELPRIDHEIAHMVEMRNPERWTKPDWGIQISTATTGFKTTGGFFAALSRETRVRAIQQHMNPSRQHLEEFVGPLKNEHFWRPKTVASLPFGKFNTLQDVLAWARDLHDKTYAAWSLDRIKHEWDVRLNHIQNWMETRVAA